MKNQVLALTLLLFGTATAEELTIRNILDTHYKNVPIYIGASGHQKNFGTISDSILNKEFGYITPINDFKQSYIHPMFDKWKWDRSDAWIQSAIKNNQLIRIHGPISPQCSPWTREDKRTAAELSRMLDEFFIALCSRYSKDVSVKWIDVVNETIAVRDIKDPLGNMSPGDWFTPRTGSDKWENPWTVIGYDESSDLRVPLYINRAFEIANEYAPDKKYLINQHGAFESEVWEKMKKLVAYLRDKGRKVDAIGWQAHVDTGWEKIPGNTERLASFIDWCHQNDLEFHITEYNVWLKNPEDGNETDQANTTEAIFRILHSKRDTGVIGFNVWGVIDSDTANPDWNGALWNNDGSKKESVERIRKVLLSGK